MYRGSRKHVLDWTDRPGFPVELLQLVEPVHVRIFPSSKWMPRGYREPDEARLETFGPLTLPGHTAWPLLRRWWLVHERGANTPNWDLALGCEINGYPGLLLVEAKANAAELSEAGKKIKSNASVRSVENHERIRAAIEEAQHGLQDFDSRVALSRDTHYQLSNRVAFAWKLATLGIPTVLVYLGFTGDWGIEDVGPAFRDDSHWRAVFADYATPVVPMELFEGKLDCGPASAWLLVRSRPVIEVSPAPAA